MTTYNRPMNHIALSVPDIDGAVKWYTENLGFQQIGKTYHADRSSVGPFASIFLIYGDRLKEVKVAILTTGNGVGFEMFEFINPVHKRNETTFEYERAGVFHICFTDPDPEALAQKVIQAGGSQIGETIKSEEVGVTALYLKDPWGNVIEAVNTSFDRIGTNLSMY